MAAAPEESSLWRSENMQLVQIFIPLEAAHSTMDELGKVGCLHLRDMNYGRSPFQRGFADTIKLCDDMERTLRFFEEEIHKAGLPKKAPRDLPTQDVSVQALRGVLHDLEADVRRMNGNYTLLRQNYNELIELSHVLKKAQDLFENADSSIVRSATGSTIGDRKGEVGRARLGYISGVVNKEKMSGLERLCFRALRGIMYLRSRDVAEPIPDAITGEPIDKAVFIVFFQGETARNKLTKICDAMGVHQYHYPEDRAERELMIDDVERRIADVRAVIEETDQQRKSLLQELAEQLSGWQKRVLREAAIAHALNHFASGADLLTVPSSTPGSGSAPTPSPQAAALEAAGAGKGAQPPAAKERDASRRRVMVGEAWCPVGRIEDVRVALLIGQRRAGVGVASVLNAITPRGPQDFPPTMFKSNKFTRAFQEIVDAYGIARYREINPAVLTCVTFPFLFGVMFGDVGHGVLMLLFALFLVLKEKSLGAKPMNEMVEMCFMGRYVLLLMAIFSIFAGFMYNDFFALAFNLFGSTYSWTTDHGKKTASCGTSCRTYPIGVDPVWKGTQEELPFYNSMKMKMSIVLGVVHMSTGVCLSAVNYAASGHPMRILTDFLPQILYMMSIFGYLVFLIVFKWCTPWVAQNRRAPDLIRVMIEMFLPPFKPKEPFYPHQEIVQRVLLLIAVGSVFYMLTPKPIGANLARCFGACLRCCGGGGRKRIPGGPARRNGKPPKPRGPSGPGSTTSEESYLSPDPGSGSEMGPPARAGPAGGAGRLPPSPATAVVLKPISELDPSPRLTGGSDITGSDAGSEAGDDSQRRLDEGFTGEPLGHDPDSAGHDDDGIVHQLIHAVEFILGGVSNTASYLRLWALSLAHAELSHVFLERVLMYAVKKYSSGYVGPIALFVAFAIWAAATVAVLLVMETLSAFLHALRLHWVEFQNKFYSGDGYRFQPFSYENLAPAAAASAETRKGEALKAAVAESAPNPKVTMV